MEEDTARALQVVAGVFAVAAITVAALSTQPTDGTQVLAIVGSAFALIAALLGVHYGVTVSRNGTTKENE